MKKTILAIAALAVTMTGFSQDLMSKKGEAYLPEANDYALGFDAVGFFNSLKTNDASRDISAGYVQSYGILTKRFIDAKTAYRFGVRLGINSQTSKEDVHSFNDTIEDNASFVENALKTKGFNLVLSVGKEFRRGNTRVQGYYGYEGMISFGSGRTTIEYGNNLSDMPTVNPYVEPLQDPRYGNNSSVYVTETRTGLNFGLGARAFFGVEYFIAPKISLNAEYGIGAMYNIAPRGEVDQSTVNNSEVINETINGKTRATSFNLMTDVSQGAVRILFHF